MEKYEMLKHGTKWKSNTVYRADVKRYDIYEEDTILLDERIYLSYFEGEHPGLKTTFYLHGLENTVLDFGGAVVVLHGKIQPFVIDECKNVTIRNVTVEYERSFHTEFEIIGREDNALRLKKPEKFPCRVERGHLIP